MLLEIFLTIIFILAIWGLPILLVSLLIKKMTKKKISKGWCVFLWLIFFMFSNILSLLIGLDWTKLGIFWKCLSASITWGIIDLILYDRTIPSILDTEKELKEKRNKTSWSFIKVTLAENWVIVNNEGMRIYLLLYTMIFTTNICFADYESYAGSAAMLQNNSPEEITFMPSYDYAYDNQGNFYTNNIDLKFKDKSFFVQNSSGDLYINTGSYTYQKL